MQDLTYEIAVESLWNRRFTGSGHADAIKELKHTPCPKSWRDKLWARLSRARLAGPEGGCRRHGRTFHRRLQKLTGRAWALPSSKAHGVLDPQRRQFKSLEIRQEDQSPAAII